MMRNRKKNYENILILFFCKLKIQLLYIYIRLYITKDIYVTCIQGGGKKMPNYLISSNILLHHHT